MYHSLKRIFKSFGFGFITATALLSGFSSYAANTNTTVSQSNVKGFYINTSKIDNPASAHIAVLDVSGLANGCNGVWFDTTTDKLSYSTVISAMSLKMNIYLEYDNEMGTPWGNPSYCALKIIALKP